MFVVMLKFTGDKDRARQLMEAHKLWIERGFADGVFALVGTLQPSAGGVVFARGISRADLEARVSDDPFVSEKLVTPEILEVTPSRSDERLAFMR